jgi:hypothetical protein
MDNKDIFSLSLAAVSTTGEKRPKTSGTKVEKQNGANCCIPTVIILIIATPAPAPYFPGDVSTVGGTAAAA